MADFVPSDGSFVAKGLFDLNTLTRRRGNFLIRKEIVADLKISGYVWTGPQ